MRNALKQAERRLDKYQSFENLLPLLNRTCESEKELLDYKFKLIDNERSECAETLKKIFKRQKDIFSSLRIAHTSTLDDIQHKLEILK